MADNKYELANFYLIAIYKKYFEKIVVNNLLDLSKIPSNIKEYKILTNEFIKLIREINDDELKIQLIIFLKYGLTWANVKIALLQNNISKKKYIESIQVISKLLQKKYKNYKKQGVDQFDLGIKLYDKVKIMKVNIKGFRNNIKIPKKKLQIEMSINIINTVITNKRSASEFVYIHNPYRDELAFAKKSLFQERLSDGLLPFVKHYGISIYTASLQSTISHIIKKYNIKGVLNLVAISNPRYVRDPRQIDDRVLFCLFHEDEKKLVPLEFFFCDTLSEVGVIHLETLLYLRGMCVDEIRIIELNNEYDVELKKNYPVSTNNRTVLIGGWSVVLAKTIADHVMQNVFREMFDFVCLIAFYKKKNKDFNINDIKNKSLSEIETLLGHRFSINNSFISFLQINRMSILTMPKYYMAEKMLSVISHTELSNEESKVKKFKDILKKFPRGKNFINEHERLSSYWERSVKKGKNMFTEEDFDLMMKLFSNANKIRSHRSGMVRSIMASFEKEFVITIGNKLFLVLPVSFNNPTQKMVRKMIGSGYREFIFYGTSGKVNIPNESIVVPKVLYIDVTDKYINDPSKCSLVPIENWLLDGKTFPYMMTDNFYKTQHLHVTTTFQETKSWFRNFEQVFGKRGVSVDMEISLVAQECIDSGSKLGYIAFCTDEIGGKEHNKNNKPYFDRQVVLSLMRSFGAQELLINEQSVNQFALERFRELIKILISETLF